LGDTFDIFMHSITFGNDRINWYGKSHISLVFRIIKGRIKVICPWFCLHIFLIKFKFIYWHRYKWRIIWFRIYTRQLNIYDPINNNICDITCKDTSNRVMNWLHTLIVIFNELLLILTYISTCLIAPISLNKVRRSLIVLLRACVVDTLIIVSTFVHYRYEVMWNRN